MVAGDGRYDGPDADGAPAVVPALAGGPSLGPGTLAALLETARRLGGAGTAERIGELLAGALVDLVGFDLAVIALVAPLAPSAGTGAGSSHRSANRSGMPGAGGERAACAGGPRTAPLAVGALDVGTLDAAVLVELFAGSGGAPVAIADGLAVPLRDVAGALVGVAAAAGARVAADAATQESLLGLLAGTAAGAFAATGHAPAAPGEWVPALLDALGTGVALLDDAEHIVQANRAFAETVGVAHGSVAGTPLAAYLGEDAAALGHGLAGARAGGSASAPVLHRVRRPDGALRWLRSSAGRVESGDGAVRLVLECVDVTEERRALEELHLLAHHDPLTGLPNRKAALERIDAAVRGRAAGETVAVMFCDLDGFKRVNDTFGHLTGDRVLADAAQRLAGALSAGDMLFRLGGDEFVVLAERLESRAAAQATAERLILALLADDGTSPEFVEVSMSVGLAFADDDDAGASALELVSAADHALYRAKRGRRRGQGTTPSEAMLALADEEPPPAR